MDASGLVSWIDGAMVYPGLISVLFAGSVLPLALLVVRWSPGEPASEKHRVLVVAVLTSFLVIAGSMLLMPLTIGEESMRFRPPLVWRLYGAPVLLAGSVLWTLVHLAGSAVVAYHITRGRRASRQLRAVATDAANSLNLRTTPPVVVSPVCRSPYTSLWGLGTIVVPAAFEDEHRLDQRGILLHEAAHVARGDCALNALCQFAGILVWWNPFYWIVMREIRLQRELACDAAVLERHRDRSWYAGLLVRLTTRVSVLTTMAFGSAPMAAKSTLRRRLEAIASQSPRFHFTDFEVRPMATDMMLLCVLCISVLVLLMESSAHPLIGEVFGTLISEP